VLQSQDFRNATTEPWHNGNRQIHEDLGVSFFVDHIGSLTERFDSKLAGVGVTWATRTVVKAATTRQVMIEADTYFEKKENTKGRSKWPCRLSIGSEAARLLGLRVRIRSEA